MQALFNIRGKMIVVETDPSISIDTVKVRSLDSFAALMQELDGEAIIAFGKDEKPVEIKPRLRRKSKLKKREPKKVAQEEQARIAALKLSNIKPTPETGWKSGSGKRIYIRNFGVDRIDVAQAINEKSSRLTDAQLRVLGMRYGIGKYERPHGTDEIAAQLYPKFPTLSGQARVSKETSIALRRLGFRITHRNRRPRNGTHEEAAVV